MEKERGSEKGRRRAVGSISQYYPSLWALPCWHMICGGCSILNLCHANELRLCCLLFMKGVCVCVYICIPCLCRRATYKSDTEANFTSVCPSGLCMCVGVYLQASLFSHVCVCVTHRCPHQMLHSRLHHHSHLRCLSRFGHCLPPLPPPFLCFFCSPSRAPPTAPT